MTSNLDASEWITVSQAAQAFGRTRQAIAQQVKAGKIEAKPMGNKQVLHVNKQALVNLLASFASKVNSKHDRQVQYENIDANETSKLIVLYKQLLEKSEREMNELKIELAKEREENRQNQKEVFKLMNEIKSILNKESGITSWIRTFKK